MFNGTDKYIALLEEENARLKKRNEELEESLKKVTDDWLVAVNEWNETVDKLHKAYKIVLLWKQMLRDS